MNTNFSCPRTCPLFGEHWCRFRPILDCIGPVQVNSHTAKVKVDFADKRRFADSIKALGGTMLGAGRHRLFERAETGLGFTLPGWKYPLVLGADGNLAYDDYRGQWGNVADLEKLKAEYSHSAARSAAEALGWQCETTASGELLIHHPEGGQITLASGGTIATAGFTGAGCHDAVRQLGIQELDVIPTSESALSAVQSHIPAR